MKKIFPVAVALILAGAFTANAQIEKKEPPEPKEPVKVVDEKKFTPPASVGMTSQNEFLMRNPGVASVEWNETKTIVLKLKSGKEEKYNLTIAAEKKAFTEKYGKPPIMPPPPPQNL